ncbi:hypothetical protein Tsubulata_007569 [Turnera subulata]|uniref:DUF4283 domain-containing protein n=1 Tax=Turnera subulata TaxID=218843 RepID=A0A9Q0F1B5_9ROSI|nr:hypothetical protein Tsubulata_007569 [Turnera subulata]
MSTAAPSARWPPKPPDSSGQDGMGVSGRPSFKDKLMQWRSGVIPYKADDGFKLTDEDVRVELKADGSSFTFSERFKSHIACQWTSSVIIKVLGRRFSYRMICSKIAFLWKPQGGFQVVDLDNDYFLVRFEKREDYGHVLANGPWMIQGSYITVQSWSAGFDVSREPTRTVVWVQIPKMPAERAKFARLTIEVDLSKPLLGWVEVEQWWYKVCYEDLPDVCFGYGTISHLEEHCPTPRVVPVASAMAMETEVAVTRLVEIPETSTRPKQVETPGQLGPWMKVSRQPLLAEVHRDAVRSTVPVASHGDAAVVFQAKSTTDELREKQGEKARIAGGQKKMGQRSCTVENAAATVTGKEPGAGSQRVDNGFSGVDKERLAKAFSYPKRQQGKGRVNVLPTTDVGSDMEGDMVVSDSEDTPVI